MQKTWPLGSSSAGPISCGTSKTRSTGVFPALTQVLVAGT
jgi:hypothetical protein